MSNLDTARDALVYARDGLSYYKSNNKSYKNENHQQEKHQLNDYDSMEFRIAKQMIFQSYDATRPKPGEMMEAIIQYGRAALKQRAGNCQEYTAVVCHYLDTVMPRPLFDAVYLEPPADHTFVVIGEAAGLNGEFPMLFSDWNHDTAICDPWANLACLASEYPKLWQAKLQRWADKEKRLPGASKGTTETGIAIPGGWSTPLEAQWVDAPITQKKLSFTYRAPTPGKKRGCYITSAVCTGLRLPDDCEVLTVLRGFRDRTLLRTPEGRREVADYYAIAPAVVDGIARLPCPDLVYRQLYLRWLQPAVGAVRRGEYSDAYRVYREMVAHCVLRYGQGGV